MNFYEVLHISQDAPVEIIKLAYKGLAQKYHPDRYKGSDANEKMVLIRKAYEVLTDPNQRKEHDQYLYRIRMQKQAQEEQIKNKKIKEEFEKYKENINRNEEKFDISSDRNVSTNKIGKNYLAYFLLAIVGITCVFIIISGKKSVEERQSIDNTLSDNSAKDTSIDNDNITEVDENNSDLQDSVETMTTKSSEDTFIQQDSLNDNVLEHDEKLLLSAISQLKSTYDEGGLIGLVSDIDRCYKEQTSLKYCFYLDYSSRIFDVHMSEALGTEPYDFFSDEKFMDRIFKFYLSVGVTDMDVANKHLMEEAYKINDQLADKFSN